MGKKRIRLKPVMRDVVDPDTAEVMSVPDYIQLVSFDLGNWFKLMLIDDEVTAMMLGCFGMPFMVFYVLLGRTNWKECSVNVDVLCRDDISRMTLLKSEMIMKHVANLCKGKMMKKISGTSYMINPRFFFIGDKGVQMKLINKYNSYGNKF